MVKHILPGATRKISWGAGRVVTVRRMIFNSPLSPQVEERSREVLSETGDVEDLGEHLAMLNDSVMMELYGELKNTTQQSICHELTRVYHLLQLANKRINRLESQYSAIFTFVYRLYERIEYIFQYVALKLAPTPPSTPPSTFESEEELSQGEPTGGGV